MSEKIKLELSKIECWRIIGCLMNEALKHKELSEDYKKQGYKGIALDHWGQGLLIMEARQKIKNKLEEKWAEKEAGKK